MNLTDKMVASDEVVARDVGGETVLLNLASGTYFGLNSVGARIWTIVENDENLSMSQVCDTLANEFDVSRQQLEGDVLNLATELVEQKLVVIKEE